MNKEQFINFLQSQENISLSNFLCERLNGFIAKASPELLARTATALIQSNRRYINDKEILEALQDVLKTHAKKKAMTARIEKYKGSRYEEEQLLQLYFYREELARYELAEIL